MKLLENGKMNILLLKTLGLGEEECSSVPLDPPLLITNPYTALLSVGTFLLLKFYTP
jgi:hypothetical protein